jgi:glyoxylase-like metal-dependent hydrolase (beta-lactamase superfamily II)
MKRLAALAALMVAAGVAALQGVRTPARSEIGKVEQLAPDVYFYEGDLRNKGHCNNGWVVFEDYVLVIDANFPSGARETIEKIRGMTNKPIRFAFDTHHHGDHAYGNQVWVENGATPVAHTGVIEEMKKYETGYYGGKPGRWEEAAQGREDVRGSKLKPPSLLFPDTMIFDDGKHRVELHHFGVAHTHGDGFAWLPKEKILFTGDACVNGPYNYMGDGDSGAWIRTLQKAKKLGARVIGPGHGPFGDATVLDDQILYFQELRKAVRSTSDGKSPDEVQSGIDAIRAKLTQNSRIARYVGDFFPAQVGKVYQEMTGKTLPDRRAERAAQRMHLAWHHEGS